MLLNCAPSGAISMKSILQFIAISAFLALSPPALAASPIDDGIDAFTNGDYATAMLKLRPKAAEGQAIAQNYVGVMYALGRGIQQDKEEAAKWYRLAADQGHSEAQFNLGATYETGQGVEQNFATAMKWYRLAADRGYPGGQSGVAGLYFAGKGVPQDFGEARKWFQLAADQGLFSAEAYLGIMYADGLGMPKNPEHAFMWFNLAAAQGDQNAARRRDEMAAKMEPTQLTEGRRLLQAWKPAQ
jgi:uncharacterized protein